MGAHETNSTLHIQHIKFTNSFFWCTSSLCYAMPYDTILNTVVLHVKRSRKCSTWWVPSFGPFSERTESATLSQRWIFSAAISSGVPHCRWRTTPFVNSTHNSFWENVGQLHLKFCCMPPCCTFNYCRCAWAGGQRWWCTVLFWWHEVMKCRIS